MIGNHIMKNGMGLSGRQVGPAAFPTDAPIVVLMHIHKQSEHIFVHSCLRPQLTFTIKSLGGFSKHGNLWKASALEAVNAFTN